MLFRSLRYQTHEVVPPRGAGDSDKLDYPRDLMSGGTEAYFDLATTPTMFARGVLPGDSLSVHEEISFYADTNYPQLAVQTFRGSQRVVAPVGAIFTDEMVGHLISIGEGDDTGMYRVTSKVDSRTLLLDRPLTASTPAIILSGSAQWGAGANAVKVVDATAPFTSDLINKWITIYGTPADPSGAYYQGSFKIVGVPTTSQVDLDSATLQLTWFPAYPYSTISYVVTDPPNTAPATVVVEAEGAVTGAGTKLVGGVPIRMYNDIPQVFPIVTVSQLPSESKLGVTGTIPDGLKQPYRITRANIRRVNGLEMSDSQEGAFYYLDTEVLSLGADARANIPVGSYLTLRPGTYTSYGYRHSVADPTLTYSLYESGMLSMPTRILPTFSSDSEENMLNIVGSPVQVTYEMADLVSRLQAFMDSAEDRVTSANLLARHFLPCYVSYDVSYVGGSAPSVIAADIVSYIDSIPMQNPVDVSLIQDLIARRGGNVVTPSVVAVLNYDWDRRVWAEFSANQVGGMFSSVPYNGSARVSSFRAGKDVSGQTVLPVGERINLTRV